MPCMNFLPWIKKLQISESSGYRKFIALPLRPLNSAPSPISVMKPRQNTEYSICLFLLVDSFPDSAHAHQAILFC